MTTLELPQLDTALTEGIDAMPSANNRSPIEVWLSQKNLQVTCRVVNEDESTSELDVDSLSLRGAQREITGYFIGEGYAPIGRWEMTIDDPHGEGNFFETVRRFVVK